MEFFWRRNNQGSGGLTGSPIELTQLDLPHKILDIGAQRAEGTPMIKKLFYLILIVAAGIAGWFAFAIWIELYSVYSYPPSKENPKGVTLIIHRDEWEPRFNSPDYKPPKRDEGEKGGAGWSKSTGRPKRPIPLRTIVKLPYIEWAYKKSIEPQKP